MFGRLRKIRRDDLQQGYGWVRLDLGNWSHDEDAYMMRNVTRECWL